jgi:hypothetical protein
MKKIFILVLFLAPMMANADPIGPSAASGTPVLATASAPYATATVENGDTTNVVSASYVKGAYNNAIAAINKVNNTASEKQDKIWISADGILTTVSSVASGSLTGNSKALVSDKAVKDALDAKRVNAVTTWGSNSVTQLGLSSLSSSSEEEE